MIHHTRAIYSNGLNVDHGVSSENLARHIWTYKYVLIDRALFVDGYCLQEGKLDAVAVVNMEKQLQKLKIKMKRDTSEDTGVDNG